MRILASLLSVSVLVLALPAQESSCCQASKAQAVAGATASPAKALTALAAEIKALPQERKAELAAAAKTMSEACPGGRGAVQLLTVLRDAGEKVNECCNAAMPGGSHEGDGTEADATKARIAALSATLHAQLAVLAELGVKLPEKASCCAGEKNEKTDAAAVPAHCVAELQKSFAGIPAAMKALDEPTRAKIAAAGEVLHQAKVTPAMSDAFGYYARELTVLAKELDGAQERGERAAEGGCPVGQQMVDSAASMADTAHALAKIATAFAESASAAGCGESGGACCESGKAEKKDCCEKMDSGAAPKNN